MLNNNRTLESLEKRRERVGSLGALDFLIAFERSRKSSKQCASLHASNPLFSSLLDLKAANQSVLKPTECSLPLVTNGKVPNTDPDVKQVDFRKVISNAFMLTQTDTHEAGIAYAESHLPADLSYTAEILRANFAISRGSEKEWLKHLNSYLAEFGIAPLCLSAKEGSLLDRFTTAPLPPVTGGPVVTVIMPAWNAQDTVRAAARSVLNQTWRNLELIIVDDASEDGTWGVLQELAATDDRIRIMRNKVNVGPYVSKNIAMTWAKGDYVTGHDADDWAHPQRLESHLKEVLLANGAIKASLTYMVRMEPDGRFWRISNINGFSIDGVTRKSCISCLFDRSFLHEQLGSWDCIRFGADSEIINRAKTLLGDGYREFRQMGMICLEMENGLTNHAELGVDRVTGLSAVRLEYAANWRAWHFEAKPEALMLPFPSFAPRVFDAPEVVRIMMPQIYRNHYAINPGGGKPEPVTAICVSKRPHFTEHIASILRAQTYDRLKIIYVAHGPDHDVARIKRAFAGVKSLQVLLLNEENTVLADGLNLALDHCDTDLVAKIDDDDFYGPDYIANSVLALKYSGFKDVALTGKTRTFIYVEGQNVFGLRFKANTSNTLFKRVHGGTLFWSRAKTGNQRFVRVRHGTDSHFTHGVLDQGLKIYSSDPYDYVHIRYSDILAHNCQIEDEEFMKHATIIASGLRLDLAYSCQMVEFEKSPKTSSTLKGQTLRESFTYQSFSHCLSDTSKTIYKACRNMTECKQLLELKKSDFQESTFFAEIDGVQFPLRFLSGGDVRNLVISFHGAINREKREIPAFLPFQPGLSGIAHQIAISDPTMYSRSNFTLSWYTGHEGFPCQSIMPTLINAIKQLFDIERRVYFGSSGGGFAALFYSWVDQGSIALVRSPQTNIMQYYSGHIERYRKACWPELDDNVRLSEKIVTDVSPLYKNAMNNTVIYLQSSGDSFHISNHMIPFLQGMQSNISEKNNRFILNCDFWGKFGHSSSVPQTTYLPWMIAALTSPSDQVDDILRTRHELLSMQNSIVKKVRNEKNRPTEADLKLTALLRDWQLKQSN